MSGYVALGDALIDQLAQTIEADGDTFYEWFGKDGNAGASIYGTSVGFPVAYEYQGYTYTASYVPQHTSSIARQHMNGYSVISKIGDQISYASIWR